MTRALKWKKDETIVSGGNRHLYNKLLKIHDDGYHPRYSIEFESNTEKEVLEREIIDISKFGIENLCNLTYGGEGETRTKESLEKLSQSLRKFWDSENGYLLRQKYSSDRSGYKNPMYGIEMSEEDKKIHIKALLSVPRWNKGLKNDPRSKGHCIGTPANNALHCRLINNNGTIIEAKSLKELSTLSGVPLISINRMRSGKKNKKSWELEIL